MSTWLITGTSSGLGRALAEQAVAQGHHVAATARDPGSVRDLEQAHPDSIAAIGLDVTDPGSMEAALSEVKSRFGDVDVLVNNAGYGYTAAIEEGEDDPVATLFETNLFGPLRLVRAVLPGMRAQRSGVVVTISSVGARITLPGGGYYSAAKAAIEAASGSLAAEVTDLGIHVMVVEPGSLRTDFRGRSARRSQVRLADYDDVLGRTGDRQLGPQRGDPAKAALAILAAAGQAEPPALLLLGSDALVGYHAHVAAQRGDVERHEHLTISTDADPDA